MMQPNPKDRPEVSNLINHRKLKQIAETRKNKWITSKFVSFFNYYCAYIYYNQSKHF